MKKSFLFGFTLLFSLVIGGCFWNKQPAPSAQNPETINIAKPTIYTTLAGNSKFITFTSLIQKVGLEKTLNDQPNLTIFAPTNEALKPLLENKKVLDIFTNDNAALSEFLQNHIVNKKIDESNLTDVHSFPTLSGGNIALKVTSDANGKKITMNDTGIVFPETSVSNGSIFEINTPLLTPKIKEAFESTDNNISENIENENNATDSSGTSITPPSKTTAQTDIEQPILTIPSLPTKPMSNKNVVDILRADGRFTKFLFLLEESHLLQSIQEAPEITIFAPTDDAFNTILADKRKNDFLFSDNYIIPFLLSTHITSGKLMLQDIAKLTSIQTFSGVELSVTQGEDNSIMLGMTSKIKEANIVGSNGIIHVLDSVIFPDIPKNFENGQ